MRRRIIIPAQCSRQRRITAEMTGHPMGAISNPMAVRLVAAKDMDLAEDATAVVEISGIHDSAVQCIMRTTGRKSGRWMKRVYIEPALVADGSVHLVPPMSGFSLLSGPCVWSEV